MFKKIAFGLILSAFSLLPIAGESLTAATTEVTINSTEDLAWGWGGGGYRGYSGGCGGCGGGCGSSYGGCGGGCGCGYTGGCGCGLGLFNLFGGWGGCGSGCGGCGCW
jgi:hypothetical protein